MKYFFLFILLCVSFSCFSQDKFKSLKAKHDFAPVLNNVVLFPGMENSSTPEYIGGKEGLDNFVKNNIIIPNGKVKDIVTLMYIINSKGQIINIQVSSNTPDVINKPLIDVLKKSGPWIPGHKNGKYISMNLSYSYEYK